MLFYDYYYLVYKVYLSNILWIIDESKHYQFLLNKINDYQSGVDQYLIIKTRHNKVEMINIYNNEFKRYRIFNLNDKSKIIYKTQRIVF